MTTQRTVDVLLAVYNGAKFLPAFLESLSAQTFGDFRLVVSDNKSSDETVEILRSHEKHLQGGLLILPPPEATTSAHLNFARVTTAGDAPYIMYADADDVWRPDKVEKTLRAMKTAENTFGALTPLLVHSDLRVVDEKLSELHASYWRYQHLNPCRTRLRNLLVQNCVTGCTAMANRALFDLGRPIPEDSAVHDHWYALVAALLGRIITVHEPLIEYRQHQNNVTGAKAWGTKYIGQKARNLYGKSGARSRLRINILQAQVLMERYRGNVSEQNLRTLEAFATLLEQDWATRRWRIVRWGFWKYGWVRNCGLLLAV